MHPIAQALDLLKSALCKDVDLGGLHARNAVAHKWKAPFRSLTLREGVAWRTQDLLAHSLLLHESGNALGARILLRSALETVAVLIYLNQLTRKVLLGSLDFHEYSDKTATLLLGSRDKSTNHVAINIVTVLQKCNARYPGIEKLYAALSESAHPNYEGVLIGYLKIDQKNFVTNYSNRWAEMYGAGHADLISDCLAVFLAEYNEEWAESFDEIELWIAKNDVQLESTKGGDA